jgi:hypothetical protein
VPAWSGSVNLSLHHRFQAESAVGSLAVVPADVDAEELAAHADPALRRKRLQQTEVQGKLKTPSLPPFDTVHEEATKKAGFAGANVAGKGAHLSLGVLGQRRFELGPPPQPRELEADRPRKRKASISRLRRRRSGPGGSINGSIPGARCRLCKWSRQKRRQFTGTLQSPLTDSNRRPPPYHALQTASGRNARQ